MAIDPGTRAPNNTHFHKNMETPDAFQKRIDASMNNKIDTINLTDGSMRSCTFYYYLVGSIEQAKQNHISYGNNSHVAEMRAIEEVMTNPYFSTYNMILHDSPLTDKLIEVHKKVTSSNALKPIMGIKYIPRQEHHINAFGNSTQYGPGSMAYPSESRTQYQPQFNHIGKPQYNFANNQTKKVIDLRFHNDEVALYHYMFSQAMKSFYCCDSTVHQFINYKTNAEHRSTMIFKAKEILKNGLFNNRKFIVTSNNYKYWVAASNMAINEGYDVATFEVCGI